MEYIYMSRCRRWGERYGRYDSKKLRGKCGA
jgi:hypothetical protein